MIRSNLRSISVVFAILLVLLVSLGALAQAPRPLTLKDAVTLALQQNLQALFNYNLALAQLERAAGGPVVGS